MAIPKRQHLPGTYFITGVTYNRRRLFQVEANAQLFLTTLQHPRPEGRFLLHASIVKPNHLASSSTHKASRAGGPTR